MALAIRFEGLVRNGGVANYAELARLGHASSPALGRCREERAILARLDRLEREEQLIPRDEPRLGLSQIVAILRTCDVTMQRQCGTEAVEMRKIWS